MSTSSSPPPKTHPSLTLHAHRSPHKWFTPTHLYFEGGAVAAAAKGKGATWQSRRARRARYAAKPHSIHDAPDEARRSGGRGLGGPGPGEGHKAGRTVYLRVQSLEQELRPHLMVDISFWVAVAFTFGSAVWVVNGFIVWFPILFPDLSTTTFTNTAAALAFIGGTVFEIGSYLMVVEALDRGRELNFGTALGMLLHHRRRSHQSGRRHITGVTGNADAGDEGGAGGSNGVEQRPSCDWTEGKEESGDGVEWPSGAKGFLWWGKPLWHDLGYVAALIQLFAASVFWISTLTGLPGVIPGLYDGTGSVAIIDVFYWTPQVVGGTGFITSSLLLMLEVQERWYIPAIGDIGWWVAVWNLVGALGFTLCGAFGYSPLSGMKYQSALSTWWGSWAFLFGSLAQCWEVVWREPQPKETEG
ncbi:hypothetical protein EHS25_005278 [Saitozyma podzolica]|uniref:Integral membrane protein n=1 Tax=Saitozyma podzolica TaxID=1890683 RepID=A0A427XYZ0_9TREE|nr:hypothetical protein EHS25_005278 [Saitozyma podzolica]